MSELSPFLVYRDQIGAASEIEFLRRQYIGFSCLRPVWFGRTVLPGAGGLGNDVRRVGGTGLTGPLNRFLFRHFGLIPGIGRDGFAPVLHAQFARGGALALPLACNLGLRMAVTLHGGDVSKQKNWRGTVLAKRWPALLRETAAFVCVSAAVADIAASRGVPAAKLTVLPIGVELPPVLPRSPQRNAHLFVGRFVEKKGILVIAEAMRRLRAAGDPTPLVAVGDGPLRPVLESLAREIPGVTLTGWLQPEAVKRQMASAVSLLVPSIIASSGDTEGLPSVIPEAMASGCPVIGANQGGIAEAIRDGETGLLVPPGDSDALAEAMRRISTQPDLLSRVAAAAFSHATENLNARVQSAALERLLLGL